MVPERVELGASAVKQLSEVAVEVCGIETGSVGGCVGLVEGEVDEMAVEILHIGNVAAEANDRGLGEGAESLDIGESGQRAV